MTIDRKDSIGEFGYLDLKSYTGIPTFLAQPYARNLANADVVVTGVPFDCATSDRPGARFGPKAIREASIGLSFDAPYGWKLHPFNGVRVVDGGNLAWSHGKISEFPGQLEQHISKIIANDVAVLSLGGDHYVSYPILRAHAQKHGPLSLLQFDAHTDTWAEDDPASIDHGTMFRLAIDEGIINPHKSVQVGIRTVNAETTEMNILDADTVHSSTPGTIAKKITRLLGDHPTYLTFDIDALDPAYAPGTGTPVWGGLSSAQASMILRNLRGINLVGMDIVEVSPPYDHSNITAIAGAHVAMDLICLWASRRKAI